MNEREDVHKYIFENFSKLRTEQQAHIKLHTHSSWGKQTIQYTTTLQQHNKYIKQIGEKKRANKEN